MRKTKEELNALMKKNNVNRLWSFSRVDTFKTSQYEYFLKYIKHEPEDRLDCIYVHTGTLCHDTLDKFYNNEINYSDMINEFEDGWIVNRNISGLKFDRNDEEKDNSISEKYYNDLTHFFKNHIPIKGKVVIEPFVNMNINGNIFIGYIDALYKDDENCYNIIDFKSSSIYKGATLESHSGQLILYAIALNQSGIPFEKIKCCFNFLKYCTVEYQQANGTVKTRDIERSKLGESLCSNLKVWLKKFGYSDCVDEMLKKVVDENSIESLPKEVQDKYTIQDCYVYIPLTEKLINKWINDLTITIRDIEMREKDYSETQNEKIFWDSEEQVKKESYYFATLSGYSGKLNKPYGEYLEKLENQKNNNSPFGNLFDNDKQIKGDNIGNKQANDLSWLNDI